MSVKAPFIVEHGIGGHTRVYGLGLRKSGIWCGVRHGYVRFVEWGYLLLGVLR